MHKVTRHPDRPERMFLQNHGGVYRSDDAGASWQSIADGLPSDFGFPIVVHPHEPDTVYVLPLAARRGRFPPEGRPGCGGRGTQETPGRKLGKGLPDEFFVGVMRDAMCTDDPRERRGLLRCPQRRVWASADSGDSWREIEQTCRM